MQREEMKEGFMKVMGKCFKTVAIIFFTLFCCVSFSSYAAAEPEGKLIIFHAGSLAVPFEKMEKAFEQKYPKVDVLREAGGSTKMAQMISESSKPCDIMASADFVVIDKILIPKYADWNVRFASNQLVLCYTDQSKFADKINADNWHEILTRTGVEWGQSDPNLDPCGYRALMVMQLAEEYYKKQGLYKQLLDNRPEQNVRPKADELVSLLKAGNMDYAWEYLSVAVQHGLKYIKLPEQINLGSYKFDYIYKEAKVEVTGKEPGKMITLTGQSITYGATIIKDAPNPEAAVVFMEYLLSPDGGLKILEEMGQPPFIPATVPSTEMKGKMPEPLQKLVEVQS